MKTKEAVNQNLKSDELSIWKLLYEIGHKRVEWKDSFRHLQTRWNRIQSLFSFFLQTHAGSFLEI